MKKTELNVLEADGSRSCGLCNACCITMPIVPLKKPPGTECVHLSGNKCSIYEDRPAECRSYVCLWLAGAGDQRWDRPDRLGAMMGMDMTGERPAFWLLNGETPDSMPERVSEKILTLTSQGATCLVLYGAEYEFTMVFYPDQTARLTQTRWNGPAWWKESSTP